MLPRELGRRLGRATHAWPRALRNKWLAIALLAGFFVAQERLGWWDAPRATALVVLAYFVAAFAVDAWMRGAAFCKYVCPIGQFHFVSSLVSPLEVKVRLPVVCSSCETRDCLRGNERQRGCELGLYLPRKAGNLDCTFCLDCVQACPRDNIGLLAVAPARSLVDDRRLAQRLDVAVLALVVVLGGFAVAGVMVRTGDPQGATRVVGGALVVAVALLVAAARALGRARFCRLSLALVPLGVGMWAAHLSFHLVTGWRSLGPIVQRILGAGRPDWSLACAGVAPDWLVTVELLLLDAGLLLSLYVGWRVATRLAHFLPFAAFAVALWATGALILLSPMQMRGMLP
jgi:hypothetical protein